MIVCRTLGPVEVSVDGDPAPPDLLWRKHLGLLIYLARSPKLRRTRDHLTGLLWRDRPEAAARHSLNEAVRVIRRAGGEDAIVSEAGQIRLASEAIQLDTELLLERIASGDWEGAAALVSGQFLEGFSIPEASEFEDWIEAERQSWRRKSLQALATAGEIELSGGHAEAAVALAERALVVDPCSDAAVMLVMRGLALMGDRVAALSTFESFATRVREQLRTEPGAELQALAERLRDDRMRQPPAPKSRTGRGSRPAPLIGRERELKELLAVWARCRDGRGAAIGIIQGDGGMGKTRLLEELTLRAAFDGAAIAMARAVETDLTQPWTALLALARGGMVEFKGVAATPPSSLATLARHSEEWKERFPRITSDRDIPLASAVSDVLRVTSVEQPVVLAIDDVQWVDRESLLSLTATLRDLLHCRFLIALGVAAQPSRPEVDTLSAGIGRDFPGALLRLAPFNAEQLEALARCWLPRFTREQIERVCRRVAADSAGLPLLAVELFRAVAAGLDLTGDGAWPQPFRTLDQTLPADLPGGVIAAIRVGFRRLSAPAQQVLAAASVLGERVTMSRLAKATRLDITGTERALDELEWQRWLVSENRGYSFVARIVQDIIARDMLTDGQRGRIIEER